MFFDKLTTAKCIIFIVPSNDQVRKIKLSATEHQTKVDLTAAFGCNKRELYTKFTYGIVILWRSPLIILIC